MAVPERGARGSRKADDLAKRLEALLKGRSVACVLRADQEEVVVEMTDGVRLFVRVKDGLDISVT